MLHLFVVGNDDAQQRVRLHVTKGDLPGVGRRWIGFHYAPRQLTAGDLENQVRRAKACPIGDADIHTALEAIARFTAQPKTFTRAADIRRQKVRTLNQHILCALADLRVRAAHDSGKGNAFLFVRDD